MLKIERVFPLGAVGVAVSLSVAALLVVSACHEEKPEFDNVVLVTIDTLRADHLGCYGYPRPVSPFIDSLAEHGVRFENAISSSSHTAPSHASLFTSQFPARHRVLANGTSLDPSIPTVASLLQRNGFETTAVVAVGLLRLISHGFDKVIYTSPKPAIHWRADNIADKAIHWADGRSDRSRFFLWVHFFDAHSSRGPMADPPEEYQRRLEEHFVTHAAEVRTTWTRDQGLPEEVVQDSTQVDTYDAQIAFIDAELERVFEAVEAAGQGTNTLWVITGDHGEGLLNHGYLGHGRFVYQEQIHVPLILFSSKPWFSDVVVPEMVRHVDLLPTLVDLTGITVDGKQLDLEGQSWLPLLDPRRGVWTNRIAFSQRRSADEIRLANGWVPGLVFAAQDGRFKYIVKTDGGDEFYDLEEDPFELRNLVGTDSDDERRLAGRAARKYEDMIEAPLGQGEVKIDPESIDELKALGYLN